VLAAEKRDYAAVFLACQVGLGFYRLAHRLKLTSRTALGATAAASLPGEPIPNREPIRWRVCRASRLHRCRLKMLCNQSLKAAAFRENPSCVCCEEQNYSTAFLARASRFGPQNEEKGRAPRPESLKPLKRHGNKNFTALKYFWRRTEITQPEAIRYRKTGILALPGGPTSIDGASPSSAEVMQTDFGPENRGRGGTPDLDMAVEDPLLASGLKSLALYTRPCYIRPYV
jgi:hypothetical protein